ncbi:DNA repair protein RecN [Protaetiibacter intestinalis]|uniref:DNA repair protein RecN n=1 Tax=Protaetiibacter intestinalis TaxID=2419774 RepID=A0A387BAE7_9MICO|nr:DNA repair protein RecN [Protaetiibacter intestinalis]AYF99333.1 DNA repair protein RecN [Protaetiibacter intestinalis]
MIEELSIRDLGVIGQAVLPLGPGFTAVTGETGAGKTMVVTALALLLGERADAGAIRAGSAQAGVEGRWLVPDPGPVAERVREAGGELDPAGDGAGELILARTVSAEGRSRGVVGGRSTPVGVLAELGERLVVVHGQSEQLRLRSAAAQREALDGAAGAEHRGLLERYGRRYREWRELATRLETLIAARDARAQEAERLRADLEEFAELAPRPGEDAELAAQAERLGNLEELRQAATLAQEAVSAQSGDDHPDAVALVEEARRAIARVADHDPALAPVREGLDAVSYQLAEVSGELSHYLGALDVDGARELEAVQERRAALGALARKHGGELEEVIARLETAGLRLVELDGDDDRIARLEAEEAEAAALVAGDAARLGEGRRTAAAELAERVSAELAALAMPDARLVVEVADAELGPTGRDRVAFLLQPHPGAEPRPLAKGASGGELSRVMLALEVVLAAQGEVPTFVFDEVDAGVGGAAAIEIGRRLARLAETAQVIVVTHLAQVAAFASNHLVVVKDSAGQVTASSVRRVDAGERAAEMARLLSGLPDSESGLEHARELLELARS